MHNNIAVIGRAEKGPIFHPVEIFAVSDIEEKFGSGELVKNSIPLLEDRRLNKVFLLRINYTKDDAFLDNLEYALKVLSETASFDAVYFAGLSAFKYLYKDPFELIKYSGFAIESGEKKIQLPIRYKFKELYLNGEKSTEYLLVDNSILINAEVPEQSYAELVLERDLDFEIEFNIKAYLNGDVYKSEDFITKYDFKEISNIFKRETPASILETEDKNGLLYFASTKNKYLDIFCEADGNSFIYADFDFKKYVSDNTKQIFYADYLSKKAVEMNCIFVFAIKDENEDFILEKLKNFRFKSSNESLKYISFVRGSLFNSGISINSALFAAREIAAVKTGDNPSFNPLPGVTQEKRIVYEDRLRLAEEGITTIFPSVRHGSVIYDGVTLDKNDPFHSLRVMISANRIVRDLENELDRLNTRPKDTNDIIAEIEESINSVIDDYLTVFNLKELDINTDDLDNIKVFIELQVPGEIRTISYSISS